MPVEEIRPPNPENEDLPKDSCDIVGEKMTLRLEQKRGSFVVVRYVRPVVKLKETGASRVRQHPLRCSRRVPPT